MTPTTNDETDPLRHGVNPRVSAPSITTLLTERETAAWLKVTPKTLQGWRYRGAGPRFVKLGRAVRYQSEDLQAFLLAALRTSTSDPGPALTGKPGIRIERFLEKSGRTLGRP